MATDPINDGTTLEGASPAKPHRRRARGILWFFALAGAAGCAVQGVLLYQGHEREMALRNALSTSETERAATLTGLDRTRSALQIVTAEREQVANALRQAKAEREQVADALIQAKAEREQVANALRQTAAERDGLRSTLRQTEFDRDNATRSLSAARGEVAACNEALEEAVSIARNHRDKLDEIASAIRIGMIGVADVPGEGLVFGSGYDLESEYRKIVKKYNDLVNRFNAAVDRSNDLGEIVNRVVSILRS